MRMGAATDRAACSEPLPDRRGGEPSAGARFLGPWLAVRQHRGPRRCIRSLHRDCTNT